MKFNLLNAFYCIDFINMFFFGLAKGEASYTCLSLDNDWEVAKDRLFYNVTELFFSCKYPTTNMYFTLVCDLKIALNE